MTITTQIEIDLQHTATRPVVYAKQGDTFTREVKVCLYDGGKAANINSEAPVSGDGVTAVIRFKKPDGTSGIYDELETEILPTSSALAIPTSSPFGWPLR